MAALNQKGERKVVDENSEWMKSFEGGVTFNSRELLIPSWHEASILTRAEINSGKSMTTDGSIFSNDFRSVSTTDTTSSSVNTRSKNEIFNQSNWSSEELISIVLLAANLPLAVNLFELLRQLSSEHNQQEAFNAATSFLLYHGGDSAEDSGNDVTKGNVTNKVLSIVRVWDRLPNSLLVDMVVAHILYHTMFTSGAATPPPPTTTTTSSSSIGRRESNDINTSNSTSNSTSSCSVSARPSYKAVEDAKNNQTVLEDAVLAAVMSVSLRLVDRPEPHPQVLGLLLLFKTINRSSSSVVQAAAQWLLPLLLRIFKSLSETDEVALLSCRIIQVSIAACCCQSATTAATTSTSSSTSSSSASSSSSSSSPSPGAVTIGLHYSHCLLQTVCDKISLTLDPHKAGPLLTAVEPFFSLCNVGVLHVRTEAVVSVLLALVNRWYIPLTIKCLKILLVLTIRCPHAMKHLIPQVFTELARVMIFLDSGMPDISMSIPTSGDGDVRTDTNANGVLVPVVQELEDAIVRLSCELSNVDGVLWETLMREISSSSVDSNTMYRLFDIIMRRTASNSDDSYYTSTS